MSYLNMTLHDIKPTPCANINPNDPCTSCDYINNDIYDSTCVGNDFQQITKNLYTSLYSVNIYLVRYACGV
jgi:hypothetical protein